MDFWFLQNPERLALERTKIEELVRSAGWLLGADWSWGGAESGLHVNTVLRAHGYDYEFRVIFPPLFPDAPIVVQPKNMKGRLSQHQYGGADGPLCLEWGPDNWHRSVTAAMMIESAHKLLDTENPLGQNRPEVAVVAPSRHHLALGQELRTEKTRVYISDGLKQLLATQPVHAAGSFQCSLRVVDDSWFVLVHEATPLGAATWKDPLIPNIIPGAKPDCWYTGVWIKAEGDRASIGEPNDLASLKETLKVVHPPELLARDGTSPVKGFEQGLAAVLICDQAGHFHFFIVTSKNYVWRAAVVTANMAQKERSPQATALKLKKVGIVGLGSVGSKIAISLARMGVRKFYFSDYDLLLPENLQRHALDWQSVLQHKVDAMAVALREIAADVEVDVSRIHLTGQESNAVVSGVLSRLADCDLIVDATANPRAFNVLAGVSRASAKPMVWLEVFGGGIGGIVARCRPGVDPCPQDMRAAFLGYCAQNPAPATLVAAVDYATEGSEGQVLEASDADVSIISHHAARLACDTLTAGGQSQYPHSMYLIGLTKAWVFRAPFDTIELDTSSLPVAQPVPLEAKLDPATVVFLSQLLTKKNNATAPAL